MDSDRPRDRDWLPILEAARRLGLTVDAVRKRIRRGGLQARKEGDRWLVEVPAAAEASDTSTGHGTDTGQPEASRALVVSLEDQVAFLRRELDARTEEIRRRDTIIAALTQRIPELPPGRGDSPMPHQTVTGGQQAASSHGVVSERRHRVAAAAAVVEVLELRWTIGRSSWCW